MTKRAFSDNSGFEIAGMTEHDLLEVVEIEELSGLSRWGWEAYYAELQGFNHRLMYVARITRPLEDSNSSNLAGYIVARVSASELHINNVAVRKECRRRGLGRRLLTLVLEEGQKSKAEIALLEVRSGNTTAQALYESCGFSIIAKRPNYYSDPVEDALIMTVRLTM